jgi:hypothetical protein
MEKLIGAKIASVLPARTTPEVQSAVVVREQSGREQTPVGVSDAEREKQIGLLQMSDEHARDFPGIGGDETLASHDIRVLVVKFVGDRCVVGVLDGKPGLDCLPDPIATCRVQRLPGRIRVHGS